MFVELMPLLKERTLLITVARVEEKVKVNVTRKSGGRRRSRSHDSPEPYWVSRRVGFRIRQTSCQLCRLSPRARQHLGRSQGGNGRGSQSGTPEGEDDATGLEARSGREEGRVCRAGNARSRNDTESVRRGAKRRTNDAAGRRRRGKRKAMIETKVLSRSFTYNGVKLPDPDPRMTPEEVKIIYSHQYPELATASITGPEASGEHLQYSFVRAIGTKG
jgi:PRTRC genetic system protein C